MMGTGRRAAKIRTRACPPRAEQPRIIITDATGRSVSIEAEYTFSQEGGLWLVPKDKGFTVADAAALLEREKK